MISLKKDGRRRWLWPPSVPAQLNRNFEELTATSRHIRDWLSETGFLRLSHA